MSNLAAKYSCYADLANAQVEGSDYRVYVRSKTDSSVAVVAPHGGGIEFGTSDVARAIAGQEFNLYLFEGLRRSGNYAALHLTSHRFDEPRCLAMLSNCDYVVAIHGCSGESPRVLVGGLDERLKPLVAKAIADIGVEASLVGHQFLAIDPKNICNRGGVGLGCRSS